ncbi:MAG: 2-hydroxyglutaryl-CoA dehydratase [Candidatus Aminicenantes bacterium]|nr:2-hydroxyglutaryl-CoA dehydratase [Candidatus Aminicenantes bacterium]NIM82943.1 2-hydroxyglutaryl-CoA dehydratase [Candidatus Aminicenantes bacterium]NIN22320.1 2-hydroxyglutaryl-CoA dehydratase [Candidatus Aminicenantes bacterium]NIN46088.1 2-hydroxyglutaryl-CoA dehydratase [Candidatus Aminicenantes bacterium]NIN88924.1 2-hydroxyglutaryl-CoA dehydratase [Candidatus Aminicenantes bacterium]
MVVAGIDIGSTTTKAVILNKKGKIIGKSLEPTGPNMKQVAEKVLLASLDQAGFCREDVEYIVTTGYGRNSVNWKNEAIPEIITTSFGGFHLHNKIKTILDIGGQDSKAITVGNNGEMVNFKMNDMCAAGTGRFLENMARVLGLPLKEMIEKGLTFKNPITIDTTCTVFAESEVITKLSQNQPLEDIIAGVHLAVIRRITPMLKQVGIKAPLMFSGGVARNSLVIKMIERQFKMKPIIHPDPQLVCAFGAAKIALEKC